MNMFDEEIIIAKKHSEYKPRYLFCNGYHDQCTCQNIISYNPYNIIYLEPVHSASEISNNEDIISLPNYLECKLSSRL